MKRCECLPDERWQMVVILAAMRFCTLPLPLGQPWGIAALVRWEGAD